ncbi:phage portal protein family protein [Sphingomonas hengshuiensis]|uniref:Uncharacterized protein n=1 Tax=Sphingomonas hengshuiensis TaxID=1609977 RepID=A0A7U4LG56_9SPHN|nr:DUF935 family protein [Sphingomonas hengshuiensis]AJP73160.1 hypothetical protein TS85_17220 [Sphingomonas hengshuiensis]
MTKKTDKFIADRAASIQVNNDGAKGEPFDLGDDEGDAVPAAADLAPREPDAIDRLVEDALGELGGASDALFAPIAELIDAANSMEEVRELLATRVGDLIAGMDAEQIVQLGERAGFAARIAGLIEVPGK